MTSPPKEDYKYINEIHIRKSIQKIDDSIAELQKTKSALATLLPKNKIDVSNCVITLPNGKKINGLGREIKNGS